MKRRICAVGAALSVVCPLAVMSGSADAAAKGKTKTKTTAPAVQKLNCKTNTSLMIPAGDATVAPPVAQGSEYGSATCGKPLFAGVQKDLFTVPDSGDTLAKFSLYFHAGTVFGSYDLTPSGESQNFLETDWTGTMTVKGGTGIYKDMTGVGTMTCTTLDGGIHTTCTDKLKLKPATTSKS